MSPSSASQNGSQLRSRILDSASRITTAAPRKRPPRKRPAASTPRKKRSAALALDSVTESADQVGAENANIARPTKVARHRKGSDGGQPLLPVSSTKINSLPTHQPDAGTEKFSATGPEALRLSVTPPPKHSLVPDAPRKADSRAVDLATNDQFEHSARIETETSARKSLLPESSAPTLTRTLEAAKPEDLQSLLASSSSAPSSSIDGVDYLLDESFFHELLNPSSPASTTPSKTKLAAVSPPLNTPSKTDLMSLSQNTPAPPTLASNPAPSPASISTAALTPSPILKAFVRQPLATEPFPSLPQVPSLKAEHRVLTCFRIAEVLRLHSTLPNSASPAGLTTELYARVVASPRHGNEQQIRFADLFFPDRPPYLTATATHDLGDAKSLLGDSDRSNTTSPTRTASCAKSKVDRGAQQESFKLYRAIIRLKHTDGTTSSAPRHTADAHVLSIWETDWEDVERVRGIVEPQYQRDASVMTVGSPSVLLGDQAKKSQDVGHVQIVRSGGTGWRSSMV